ncbi:DUF5753 domain-containing protein [Actinomadura litoris]|uniref:DUF5753 domain-containing protein n=1 Tax=Actinomadura litoris TaxID=2678616 RepID=A0A7K1KXN5_9ACTN|nr:DUF5753 domain-containing protein [Actinomadura litoris]MUN36823.1 hypothetical protein [Actinomadura litoris]
MKRIDDMPDDHRGNGYETVIAALAYNRYLAGRPSYYEIARVSSKLAQRPLPVRGVTVGHLPKSSAHELMQGKYSRIRRWDLVASLWATLAEIAERRGADGPEPITLEELRLHHDAVGRPPRPRPAPAAGVAGVAEGARARLAPPAPPPACDALPGPGARMAVARLRLLAEARRRGGPAWWRPYGDVVLGHEEIRLTLEPELSVIRIYAPDRVPELLRTAYYAHEMAGADLPGASRRRRERRVELCRRRQEILHRPDPPQLWVLLDERALRTTPGGSFMMRGQLARLIELARLRHITLQLVPAKSAEHAVTEGPITIMQLPERHHPYLVYIEHPAYGLYPHESNDVDYFVHAFGRLAISAWPEEETVERLRGMLDRPWATDG